jgi:hypothetical protein
MINIYDLNLVSFENRSLQLQIVRLLPYEDASYAMTKLHFS